MLDLVGRRFNNLLVIAKEKDKRNNTVWKCKCDCGNYALVYHYSLKIGRVKSCGCSKKNKKRGEQNPNWRGGRLVCSNGYIRLTGRYDHPNANKKGFLLEHRYVMSQILGRPLYNNETIHHKNGIKDDNRPENLELKVNNHGSGQSINDLINYSIKFLKRYKPDLLSVRGK